MKKLKLACLTTLLLSCASYAAPSCDGFRIKLQNNLADNLLLTDIKLHGAQITPNSIDELKSKTSQTFTVNSSNEDLPMSGEFTLRTISLPSKTVKIKYKLENKLAHCDHEDMTPNSDYPVEKTRKIGEVQYTINN